MSWLSRKDKLRLAVGDGFRLLITALSAVVGWGFGEMVEVFKPSRLSCFLMALAFAELSNLYLWRVHFWQGDGEKHNRFWYSTVALTALMLACVSIGLGFPAAAILVVVIGLFVRYYATT